jgi:Uma2 family endonuclease
MATATSPLVTLKRYLNTAYRPDRHIVDGETQRRNAGEFGHSRTMCIVAYLLSIHKDDCNTITLIAPRIQISESRIRVADLCVLRASCPDADIIQIPPLLCVEILSPKDRLSRTIQVMEDYLLMGVENLWVIDPRERIAYTYTPEGLFKVHSGQLTIPNTPIHVDLSTIFAKLPTRA